MGQVYEDRVRSLGSQLGSSSCAVSEEKKASVYGAYGIGKEKQGNRDMDIGHEKMRAWRKKCMRVFDDGLGVV